MIGKLARVNAAGDTRYPGDLGKVGTITNESRYTDGTIEYTVRFSEFEFDWYTSEQVDVDPPAEAGFRLRASEESKTPA